MPTRVCLSCSQLTSRASQRGLCPECQAELEAARPARPIYDDPRWQRLSARMVRAWVRANGWWCPGWGRERHASTDLTLDHIVPLTAGGAPWDQANLQVLCRSCNGRKAASNPATLRA